MKKTLFISLMVSMLTYLYIDTHGQRLEVMQFSDLCTNLFWETNNIKGGLQIINNNVNNKNHVVLIHLLRFEGKYYNFSSFVAPFPNKHFIYKYIYIITR